LFIFPKIPHAFWVIAISNFGKVNNTCLFFTQEPVLKSIEIGIIPCTEPRAVGYFALAPKIF
jgi:hypothetical protein